MPDILENAENELSFTARNFITRLYDNMNTLSTQIKEVEDELNQLVC